MSNTADKVSDALNQASEVVEVVNNAGLAKTGKLGGWLSVVSALARIFGRRK